MCEQQQPYLADRDAGDEAAERPAPSARTDWEAARQALYRFCAGKQRLCVPVRNDDDDQVLARALVAKYGPDLAHDIVKRQTGRSYQFKGA